MIPSYLLSMDNADLTMRMGLHSGPVTAGVLRGKRSHFQLFGDTVNTGNNQLCNSSMIFDVDTVLKFRYDQYLLLLFLQPLAWRVQEAEKRFNLVKPRQSFFARLEGPNGSSQGTMELSQREKEPYQRSGYSRVLMQQPQVRVNLELHLK